MFIDLIYAYVNANKRSGPKDEINVKDYLFFIQFLWGGVINTEKKNNDNCLKHIKISLIYIFYTEFI